MIAYLQRYYAFILVLSLVAPLWLIGALVGAGSFHHRFKDALIWSGLLLGLWALITMRRGFHIRGIWRIPERHEIKLYSRLLLGVLLIDFGSKALFFRWDRPHPVELVKNFGLHSVFHETAFEPFHFVLLIYFCYLFLIGGLFFRFTNAALDRIWMVSCTFALGGGIALFGERFIFGGVHNSFYFAGPLMWICPPCASPRFSSYAWTPADLFVHAAFMPIVIVVMSYLAPAKLAAAKD
jgi:lipoprotein signal peptidase